MPAIVTAFSQGLLGSRPSPSISNYGYYYFATDDNGGTIYQSTGVAWVKLAPGVSEVGGGSSPIVSLDQIHVGVGGLATLDFNSIPGGYYALQVRISGASDSGSAFDTLYLRINGDSTPPSYGTIARRVSAAGATTNDYSADDKFVLDHISCITQDTLMSMYVTDFPDYVAASRNKSISHKGTAVQYNGSGGQQIIHADGVYEVAAAITSLSYFLGDIAAKFAEGTVATLYGYV